MMFLVSQQDDDGSTLLLWAAEEGLADLCDGLLQLVPHLLTVPDLRGTTALHSACLMGREEVVKVLLIHGCDSLIIDENGWTPLLYALWKENVYCVLEILKVYVHV
jgi:ankyrin repeat protein